MSNVRLVVKFLGGLKTRENSKKHEKVEPKEVEIPVVSSVSINGRTACSCQKTYNSESNSITEIINGIIATKKKGVKTTVKIEVIFDDA